MCDGPSDPLQKALVGANYNVSARWDLVPVIRSVTVGLNDVRAFTVRSE